MRLSAPHIRKAFMILFFHFARTDGMRGIGIFSFIPEDGNVVNALPANVTQTSLTRGYLSWHSEALCSESSKASD